MTRTTPGFTPASSSSDRTTFWLIVGSIVAALILISAAWLDTRPVDAPLRPTIQPRASWLEGPIRAEGELAIPEQPEGGRP